MSEKLKKRKKAVSRGMELLSPFHLEADKSGGGLAIVIGGVKSVLEIGESIAKLKCGMGSVSVKGQAIDVALYENKTVEITGKVESLEFNYAKN